MSLSTVTDKDIAPKKKLWIKAGNSNLATSDIEGASPSLKGYQYFNKPSYSNTTENIEKASPKQLHQQLNKPNYNLTTKDIEKAYPTKTGFESKRIGTNPLNPVYQLPKFEINPSTPPKFIRDNINIFDIDGTKPEIYYKWNTRDSMNVNDIDGAKPKPDKKLSKPNLMDPRDINRGGVYVSNRNVNPLMPEYDVRDEDGALIKIGQVEGSIPKKTINTETLPHNRHLDNRDIDGSTAGTLGLGVIGTKERNYKKKIVDAADIEGAQSGTLKKGIITIRKTNPLNPLYTWMTEDPKDTVPEEKPNKILEDPKYSKNIAKFYGATPSVSETKSLPRSQASSRKSDFNRNANKFFNPDNLTEETVKKNFSVNAEKFFENRNPLGTNHFQTINIPGSINKPKPKSTYVDLDSSKFQKDSEKFFLVSQSRPRSNDSNNTELKYENKSPSTTGVKQAKTVNNINENESYKFSLERAEIKKPSSGFRDDRTSSDKNLLMTAGKKLIS